MDAMNINNITALADMLKQENVDGSQSASSHVTPASLGVAAPAASVTAAEAPKQQAAAARSKSAENEEGDIWDLEEVPDKIDIAFEKDSRKRPTYDILYKQSVSAMDAFGGGLTGNTPSSISCNQIVVKIKFPGHKMKDLVRTVLLLSDARFLIGLFGCSFSTMQPTAFSRFSFPNTLVHCGS